MESLLYKKVYGCLCGGLIGDAMGASAEHLTYDEIERKYGWIDSFEGAGTDDSAIKLILCKAIIDNRGYVTADEWADAFLARKEFYPLFYVPVRNSFHKIESNLELPVYAGMGNMHSSSSAMSISPMGMINACNPRQAALETYDVAGLLHGGVSTFCRDGACVMAAAVAEAMKTDATVDSIIEAGSKYLHKTSSVRMLNAIKKGLSLAYETKSYKSFRASFYKECLRDIISDSRETVPAVLALFYLAGGDAETAITYAANFGRDSDTIGTMIGSLCGAFKGIDGIPQKWIDEVEASYGSQIKISKDYQINMIEAVDQRKLTSQIVEIINSRYEAVNQTLSALAKLK
jgi:ADP-ribosylglycohydrolase